MRKSLVGMARDTHTPVRRARRRGGLGVGLGGGGGTAFAICGGLGGSFGGSFGGSSFATSSGGLQLAMRFFSSPSIVRQLEPQRLGARFLGEREAFIAGNRIGGGEGAGGAGGPSRVAIARSGSTGQQLAQQPGAAEQQEQQRQRHEQRAEPRDRCRQKRAPPAPSASVRRA